MLQLKVGESMLHKEGYNCQNLTHTKFHIQQTLGNMILEVSSIRK